jgi:hypothetical protein
MSPVYVYYDPETDIAALILKLYGEYSFTLRQLSSRRKSPKIRTLTGIEPRSSS